MNRDITYTFRESLHECDQHVDKILRARQHLSELIPIDIEKYSRLTDVQNSFIDQLIFRFSKLQDSMGEKIFPMILLLTKEEIKKEIKKENLRRYS